MCESRIPDGLYEALLSHKTTIPKRPLSESSRYRSKEKIKRRSEQASNGQKIVLSEQGQLLQEIS